MKRFGLIFIALLMFALAVPAQQAVSGASPVQGAAPSGATAKGNPVWICGLSGTNCVPLNVDSSGRIVLGASTQVLGHVITDTGSTTAVTGNTTVVQPTGTNLHAVTDSGSTTAVTGNVTVVQPTGTNLHTVTDSGSTTAVTGTVTTSNVATDPCASSAVTKSHAFANITTATTTALVPVSGSTNIFVCGIDFQSLSTVATNTILFESGTGTACAVVTGCVSSGVCTSTYRNGAVATYPPVHLGFGGHILFSTGASNGLCAVTTVGTNPTISVDVTFVQQ